MSKRLVSLLLAIAVAIACLPCLTAAVSAAEPVTITVYNWGEYMSDGSDDCIDLIAEFEAAYPGIKVNYVTFDSNESLYSLLVTGGTSIDVIIPSDYMIARLISEDMLLPLDFANIPNYAYVDETLKNPAYDPENLYSVPYAWGVVGIIYNSRYVTVSEEQKKDWSLLWDSDYVGKILMFDNPRDSFAIAELQRAFDYRDDPEKAAGYTVNSTDTAVLEDCAQLLQSQKGLVQNYVMDQIYDKMERCEAWIAPYYLGDWVQMAYVNEDLNFYVPSEAGHNLFDDAMCIPTSCSHKAEAEAFINFCTDPEISSANMEYVGYASPCVGLEEYLEDDLAYVIDRADNLETSLTAGQQFLHLPSETNQQMDALWLTVKTAGDDSSFYLILTAVTAAALIVLTVVLKVRKHRRKAHRCAAWKHNA